MNMNNVKNNNKSNVLKELMYYKEGQLATNFNKYKSDYIFNYILLF